MTSTVTTVRNGSSRKCFTDGEASGHSRSDRTKAEWRAWARSRAVPIGVSERVQAHLAAWLPPGAVVLTYLALPDEVDPGPPPDGLRLVVTRTPPDGLLTVHPIEVTMERGRLGILQPVATAQQWEGPVAVALVPGLVFGRDGSRLGRGVGHYDRLFERLRVPVRVGVAWSGRVVDRLPSEDHDVAMTHVVTEDGVGPVG
jgi:5-formyltetrahydrofolate cyclo-ligase